MATRKEHVLPLIRSLGIAHHLSEPAEELVDVEGKKVTNSQYNSWLKNDGLLTSWLLRNMSKAILSMITGANTSQQVWCSLEEQLLPMTKDKKAHVKDQLFSLKKWLLSNDEYI
ncbi:hypothetical protein Ddye_004377 [Dipteronia dyeriana]|uniref:Uncharacterized protein n=1 Tax=Dipteronia dyeriana TaxID=168575 RepID=A0AAE0CXB3_9ROSI|nr:hypothetical protein Ddye_004377 [Dipteronia dyeriana]